MTGKQTDDDIRKLLGAAGRRERPSDAMEARVHDAVLAEWEHLDTAEVESRGKRAWPLALAATVLLSAIAAILLRSFQPADVMPVGRVVFSSGQFEVRSEAASQGDGLLPNSMLTTYAGAYVGLEVGTNTSVRFAPNSSATVRSGTEIWLHRGRVYVDSPGEDDGLKIVTPLGTVTDIGTQFDVVLEVDALDVAVREGTIRLATDQHEATASERQGMGEVMRINHLGALERAPIATTDERWAWVGNATSEPQAESLHEYLNWATREAGLALSYESALVQTRAKMTPAFTVLAERHTPADLVLLVNEGTQTFQASLVGHSLIVDFER